MSLKTIMGTVGEQCMNIPADVATVQYLLNCVPASAGGPTRELIIDGFAGILTYEAIKHFQKVQFGMSDSRVESGGETFDELKKYDPLPFSAPVITPSFKASNVGFEKKIRTFGEKGLSKSELSTGGIFKRTIAHEGVKRTSDGIKGRS